MKIFWAKLYGKPSNLYDNLFKLYCKKMYNIYIQRFTVELGPNIFLSNDSYICMYQKPTEKTVGIKFYFLFVTEVYVNWYNVYE